MAIVSSIDNPSSGRTNSHTHRIKVQKKFNSLVQMKIVEIPAKNHRKGNNPRPNIYGLLCAWV